MHNDFTVVSGIHLVHLVFILYQPASELLPTHVAVTHLQYTSPTPPAAVIV